MSDTVWYKQFWPWFLIVLPSTVVIASFITLYIAFKYADTPVQGDYVQHGLTVLHESETDKTEPSQAAILKAASENQQPQ